MLLYMLQLCHNLHKSSASFRAVSPFSKSFSVSLKYDEAALSWLSRIFSAPEMMYIPPWVQLCRNVRYLIRVSSFPSETSVLSISSWKFSDFVYNRVAFSVSSVALYSVELLSGVNASLSSSLNGTMILVLLVMIARNSRSFCSAGVGADIMVVLDGGAALAVIVDVSDKMP